MTIAIENDDRAAQLYQLLLLGDEQGSRNLILKAIEQNNASVLEICTAVTNAFHAVGDAWECSEMEIYREHVASQIGLRLLIDLRSRPLNSLEADPPRAIGCTPEEDPYSLPTVMVELVLKQFGWQATSLGTNLPLEMLEPAMDDVEPKLVWVSVSHIASLPRLREQLIHLAEQGRRRGIQVICGGRALSEDVLSGIEHLDYLKELGALQRLSV